MQTETTIERGTGTAATAVPLYSLRGVTKVYGDGNAAVRALDGIDLDIGASELTVVVGSSGSGKSTLLQLLGGLDRPTSGVLEFEGRDIAGASDSDLATMRLRTVGFVFQQFNLIPTLSAAENVELVLAPAGLSGAERSQRSTEMLRRVGLEGRAGHLPSELSGGEQQRVAIARALANGPDVLLADEPTGNLDSTTGAQILELLHELSDGAEGSIVLITHDPSIAADARRVIRLADGRVSGDDRAPVVS